MLIDRIDHLVLTVNSIDATVDFYSRVLGFEPSVSSFGMTSLLFGDQKINLHQKGREFHPHSKSPTLGSGDLCFITQLSIDQYLEHLRLEKVKVLEGPVPRLGALGAMTSVYFRDPDGNLLEVASYVDD